MKWQLYGLIYNDKIKNISKKLCLNLAKPWDIVDYGVCEIEDILSEVSENTVVMTTINGGDKMIAIPKREQTAEEIERTKQFAFEVKYI